MSRLALALGVASLGALAASSAADASPTASPEEPRIRYRVSLDDRARAEASPQVTVRIANAPAPLELVFPAWLPGAYELRFYGRDVGPIVATDEGGRVLKVVRESPTRSRVLGHTAGATVTFRYRVVTELLADNGADVGPTHAYLNPGAIVPSVRGLESAPHELVIEDSPRGWRTPTGTRLVAHDYASLLDQPLELGDPEELLVTERRAAGADFTLVLHTDPNDRERARTRLALLARDLGKIVDAEHAIAGPLPFRRYTLVIHVSDRATHLSALEHAAAASVVAGPDLLSEESYSDLLHVVAHELFHAWNARRLVPADLDTTDLEHVPSSAALWITEGLTEYVSLVALARSGLFGRAQLAAALEEALTRARRAERAEISLEALARDVVAPPSSLAADPDAYYAVGHVVSMALVALLLDRSQGRAGLEELLHALLPAPDAPPRPIDTAALGRQLDALAPPARGQTPLSTVITSWVESPFKLSALSPSLTSAGLRTEARSRRRVDLAAAFDGESLSLRAMEPGGAFARAGARPGDRLLRIDGQPVSVGLLAALRERGSPSPLRLELERVGATLALSLHPHVIDETDIVLAPRTLDGNGRTVGRLARLLGAVPRR